MVNTRKSSFNLEERVSDALHRHIPSASSIVLGLSGGLDSVALLFLLNQLQPRFGFLLSAIHVHHGISKHADDWAGSCIDLCERLDIPLHVAKVDITLLRHEHGIEAAARLLRYAEFAKSKADFVALAHHQDDQVETLLLQLLRGSGVRGAAAMPVLKHFSSDAPVIFRPLLDTPRSELLDYAEQHALQWVEDDSNSDERYARNFLRHRVLPVFAEKFPAYRQTLIRSSAHFAEAAELMDELAQADAKVAVLNGRLKLQVINSLSQSRAKNLLRYFIEQQGAPLPDASRLVEMLKQMSHLRQDAKMCIAWSNWELRCYREMVHVVKAEVSPVHFDEMEWTGRERLELPQLGGVLHFVSVRGAGLSVEKLLPRGVKIRTRQGGESMRVWRNAHHRSLKNIFQENQVPPWERDGIPLLFFGNELICIPGVVCSEEYSAQKNECGVLVRWQRVPSDVGAN